MKKPHVLDEDDIRYLQENDFDEKPRKRKSSLVIMIVLIVLISLFGLIHFLENFIVSEKMYDQAVVFPEKKIFFSNNALKDLQKEYLANQHREIKACLYGKREANALYIHSVEFPKIVDADVIHIESYACPIDAIGDIHSHPIHSCIASQTDIKTLEQRRSYDPDYVMLIMCARNRFALVK